MKRGTVSRAVPARQCQLASVYDINSGVDAFIARIKIGALLPLLRYRAGTHALSLIGGVVEVQRLLSTDGLVRLSESFFFEKKKSQRWTRH